MPEAYGQRDAGEPNNDADGQRRKCVAETGDCSGTAGLPSRPMVLPRNHRNRRPVIRDERVQDAHRNDGANEEELRSELHFKYVFTTSISSSAAWTLARAFVERTCVLTWSSSTSDISEFIAPRVAAMRCSTTPQPASVSRARSTDSSCPRIRRTRFRSFDLFDIV